MFTKDTWGPPDSIGKIHMKIYPHDNLNDTIKLTSATFIKTENIQGDLTGCRPGNGYKLSSRQTEPSKAIKSAVA